MSDLIDAMKQELGMKEVDIRTYSPLVLAYIGDGVFDLIVRSFMVNKGNIPVNKLHHRTSAVVKAESQAKMIDFLEDKLTEEELAVYKRGRNAKSHTSAKNASIQSYRKATGFEALIGYMYMLGQNERMMELVKLALIEIGEIKQ